MSDEKQQQPEIKPWAEEQPATAEETQQPAIPEKKSRKRIIGISIVVIVLVLAGSAYGLYSVIQSDAETTDSVTPGGVVVLPQNPSLKMVVEEGTLYVENDGNVTISDVEVRDAAGTAVCAMGVISPGDRQPCEEAGDAQDLTVIGSGPQGQNVEAGLGVESPDS
jgi:hypothetical protein